MAESLHRSRKSRLSLSQTQLKQQTTLKTGSWLPVEDARLREAVAKYGSRWVKVAGDVGTRNGDQCAKRWTENLNPDLDHSPWTAQEDERLLEVVKTYGRNWKCLSSSFFELRAPLALKNRYSLLMRRLNRQASSQQHRQRQQAETRLQQQTTNFVSGIMPQPQAFFSRSSSETASSSLGSPFDLSTFLDGEPLHDQLPFHTPVLTPDNRSPLASPFSIGMETPRIAVSRPEAAISCEEDAAMWEMTPESDDHPPIDLFWQQQPLFNDNGNSGDRIDSYSASQCAVGGDNDSRNPLIHPLSRLPELHYHDQLSRSNSSGGTNHNPSAAGAGEVEFSVMCQRGKVKAVMNQLVDATMSETQAVWPPPADEDEICVTLRVKF